MRAVLTGATGFIGSHVLTELVDWWPSAMT